MTVSPPRILTLSAIVSFVVAIPAYGLLSNTPENSAAHNANRQATTPYAPNLSIPVQDIDLYSAPTLMSETPTNKPAAIDTIQNLTGIEQENVYVEVFDRPISALEANAAFSNGPAPNSTTSNGPLNSVEFNNYNTQFQAHSANTAFVGPSSIELAPIELASPHTAPQYPYQSNAQKPERTISLQGETVINIAPDGTMTVRNNGSAILKLGD